MQLQAKIVVLGDRGTGKSDLIRSIQRCNELEKNRMRWEGHNKIENVNSICTIEKEENSFNNNFEQGTSISFIGGTNHHPASTDQDNFFALSEVSLEELLAVADPRSTSAIKSALGVGSGVSLRFWEYSSTPGAISEQEQLLAFRGALICIITLDITKTDTANAAFNQWLALKELLAAECFLFIVGTHLDQNSRRAIELKDLCKASAKKDAIYLEISNIGISDFRGAPSNISLLRKLIIQRLNYMIERKEFADQRLFGSFEHATQCSNSLIDSLHLNETLEHKEMSILADESVNDNEVGDVQSNRAVLELRRETVAVPALRNSRISHGSVGSILSSSIGSDAWVSGLTEESTELGRIGRYLSHFVDLLQNDLRLGEEDNYRRAEAAPGDNIELAASAAQHDSLNMDQSLFPTTNEGNLIKGSTASQLEDAFLKSVGRAGAQLDVGDWLLSPSAALTASKKAGGNQKSSSIATTDVFADHNYLVNDIEAAFSVLQLSLEKLSPDLLRSATVAYSVPSSSSGKTFRAGENDANRLSQTELEESPSPYKMVTTSLDTGAQTMHSRVKTSSPNITKQTTKLRKLAVRLPGGFATEMLLDLDGNIESQIEMFVISQFSTRGGFGLDSKAPDSIQNHGFINTAENFNGTAIDSARQKLLHVARIMQRDYKKANRTV